MNGMNEQGSELTFTPEGCYYACGPGSELLPCKTVVIDCQGWQEEGRASTTAPGRPSSLECFYLLSANMIKTGVPVPSR